MSSHHIVRDEQEPALLLWQPGQIRFEQAGELLEWSPRVLVHRQALDEALAWGIKLDAVWAAAHELEEVRSRLAHQQPLNILPLPAEHALKEVIGWLREKNQASLNLIADAEAGAFALLRQLEGVQQQGIQVQLISQGWRYSFFNRSEVRKWLPEVSLVRVVAFGDFPEVGGLRVDALQKGMHLQELRLPEAGMLQLKGTAAFWLGERLS